MTLAPKSTVATKAPATKKTGTSSPLKGLQLSAAQWKAYNAAYTASASKAYQALATQQLRQSRLNAVYSLSKKVAAAHSLARTAAIAAFATQQSYRQSVLAHQNAALQQRVFADFERHMQLAGRLQFVYKGEAAYLHTAVMRTLTTAQASSVTAARFGAAVKAAKSAINSTSPTQSAAQKAATAQIQSTAQAAGLAAARATPKGRTAPRPDNLHPVKFSASFGDPVGYDCVAAAIANHLSHLTGYDASPDEYERLSTLIGPAPSIRRALAVVSRETWPGKYVLSSYLLANPRRGSRLVAGFATEKGPHAALLLSTTLVESWGEMLLLEAVITPGTAIEEAWDLVWR